MNEVSLHSMPFSGSHLSLFPLTSLWTWRCNKRPLVNLLHTRTLPENGHLTNLGSPYSARLSTLDCDPQSSSTPAGEGKWKKWIISTNWHKNPAVQTITQRTHFLIIIEIKMDPLWKFLPFSRESWGGGLTTINCWDASHSGVLRRRVPRNFLEGTVPRRWWC